MNAWGMSYSRDALLTVISPSLQRTNMTVLDTIDEASLLAAMANASNVMFARYGIINLSQTITITNDVTLDANGHQVTLSDNQSVRVFTVYTIGHLTLKHITIANGQSDQGWRPL